MKKFLNDLISKRKAEIKEYEARFEASTDAAEVRAIGETLKALKDEIAAAEEQLAKIDEDEGADNGDEMSSNDAADEERAAATKAEVRNADIMASFGQQTTTKRGNENMANYLDTMEYREAFAKYVRTGVWEYEQRDSTAGMVITTDVGKVIPNTIMNELIKKLKVYGNLYNRVRKLNVKGGVEFPIEELVPTISWITETTTATAQSVPEIKTSVSFGYHICEARIAQSLLSQVVSLDILESEIATLLAEAFIKEFDRIILNGTGSGQPTGILKDTRVPSANKIAFSASDLADWTKFRTKLFAKIPLAYRGQGIIVTTAATWETYFMTLKDANNRPLAIETYDVTNGTTTCSFAGREVQLVEPDIIKDYDDATGATHEPFAVYFRPNDYAINSNMQIGFKRYFNDDTNKWINKGLAIMDGKLLDVNGVFILTK